MDEAAYKKMMKGGCMDIMGTAKNWAIAHDMMNPNSKSLTGFKGKVTLLWPMHSAGKHDPAGKCQWEAGLGPKVQAALKTKLIDTFSFSEKDSADEFLKIAHV